MWKDPPYEYEFEKMPIDLILGNKNLRDELENGRDLFDMHAEWASENKKFDEWRKGFLLYD